MGMKTVVDVNETLDLLKIKLYTEWLYTHVYSEGESPFHKTLTERFVDQYIEPLNLAKDALIYDLGCGPGYFLDKMKEKGYTNLVGVTLSPDDKHACEKNGHKVEIKDLTFLHGIDDETVDLIWVRHALEHSPYPIFSLIEYNRVLKQGSKLYVEVPAPDCQRPHEFNANHYSILGARMLVALLERTGFTVDKFDTVTYELQYPPKEGETEEQKVPETVFCIVATKTRPLDMK